MSNLPKTLIDALKIQFTKRPSATAISAPKRRPLTYSNLYDFMEEIIGQLSSFGFEPTDRIAIVMPNGPEMATLFLAVSSCATSAPLNSEYKESDFDFYLTDLNAKALIIHAELDSAARRAAEAHNLPIIELIPKIDDEAGRFSLSSQKNLHPVERKFTTSEDVALVLHTSGTTSRPKLVPLTHANLIDSANSIQEALNLSQNDCCLNVMPLFHIHGLVGVLLSSVRAGAEIHCTPGFSGSQFFKWFKESQPTWYSAVPTMHQAILNRAESHLDMIKTSRLRFIRSSSASLPPTVMKEIENVFGVPVIEAYGMTEASHQMTSNFLPPGIRKPGSVGVAAGPEVAIMDESGNLLHPNQTGEIVIRGANVMLGYENNPEANKNAFNHNWFRTGDQGFLDSEGYLYITGRLKEIINRGGEKISPREVDEALMEHIAVDQAVTFAVPHSRLGEDVAAAVVLKDGAKIDERELRELAFSQLADFKVPSQILIVNQIPKGPTGKLQRIGLAEKLTHDLKVEYIQPRNPVEDIIARIWSDVLNLDKISVRDNFFILGGDSLMATRVVSRLRRAFNIDLPIPTLFREPRLEDLARVINNEFDKNESPADSDIMQTMEALEELSEEEAQRILDQELGIRKTFDSV